MKRWLAYELARNDHTRVGFWPLLTNDRDYSGRGNHATPVGNSGHVRAPGMNGYKVGYDGGTAYSYLSLGNCADLAFDNNFAWSVSLWYFEQPNSDVPHNLISFTGPEVNGALAGWKLSINEFGLIFFECSSNFSTGASCQGQASYAGLGVTLSNIGWNQVVLTYNGNQSTSGFHLYLNGRRLPIIWTTAVFAGSWIPALLNQAVGRIGPHSNFDFSAFSGVVRIAQAWRRELSGTEVARRYQIERAVDTFGRTEARKEFVLYLFVHGHQPLDSTGENPYLFLEGGGPSAAIPLFLNSAQPVDSEPGLPLFVNGVGSYPSSIPLFIESRASASGTIPLFLLNSTNSFTSTVNLFMDAAPAGSGAYFLPLAMLGSSGDFGLANQVPLFLEVGANGSDWTGQMNLYTAGIDQGPYATNMNLLVLGGTTAVPSSLPLYLWNSQSGGFSAMPMTCWAGPTGDPGSYAFYQSVNLFIDRPTDGFVPLSIHGDLPTTSSIPLYTQSLSYYPGNDNEVTQGLFGPQLIVQGYGQQPSITLVLPNIVGSSYLPSTPFFVHGY